MEVEGDWRGVFCTVFLVKDTLGEVLFDVREVDLHFFVGNRLMLEEI